MFPGTVLADFSTLLGDSWAVWEVAQPRDCSHVAASGLQSLLADEGP